MFLLDIKNKNMKKKFLNKKGFINKDYIGEVINSVETFYEVGQVLNALEDPKSLTKKQKRQLVGKFIGLSTSYEEASQVENYVRILDCSLTDEERCRLIMKLVKVSTTKYQMKEIKNYARFNGLLNRYMKELFRKDMTGLN